MSLEKIKAVSDQIISKLQAVKGKGEEATKQALVMPMLNALDYDVWNPTEVCPEYEADFAIKKAGQKEKVDIAIFMNGTPRIYLEVKSADTPLDGHEGQLTRYFNATPSVTLGVLTNGIEWRFYTDTGDPNIMDAQPFHTAKLDSVDQGLDVLARFSKTVFCPEAIRDFATELLYTAKIAGFLRNEIDLKDREPSEYFLRWILKSEGMYEGVVNTNVLERFKPITKAGLTRVVREIVRRSITAMDEQAAQTQPPEQPQPAVSPAATEQAMDQSGQIQEEQSETTNSRVLTTDRELAAYAIVKEHFDKSVYSSRTIYDASQRKEVPIIVSYKDTTAYFGIYLNKPSWWIIRIMPDSRQPWVGFNLSAEAAASLVPSNFKILPPGPYADFRLSINSSEDLHQLNRLILASIEKAIADRARGENHIDSKGIAQGEAAPS